MSSCQIPGNGVRKMPVAQSGLGAWIISNTVNKVLAYNASKMDHTQIKTLSPKPGKFLNRSGVLKVLGFGFRVLKVLGLGF